MVTICWPFFLISQFGYCLLYSNDLLIYLKMSGRAGIESVSSFKQFLFFWGEKQMQEVNGCARCSSVIQRHGNLLVHTVTFPLCQSAQAAITKCHRLGGGNNRNLFSHSSGG